MCWAYDGYCIYFFYDMSKRRIILRNMEGDCLSLHVHFIRFVGVMSFRFTDQCVPRILTLKKAHFDISDKS